MPNITQSRLVQLERAKDELQDLQIQEAMKPFVDEFLTKLGTLLANKPYEEWPQEAKIAFQSTARDIPTGAILYRDRLPQ